ncbi:MAG: hypothetical protein MUP85_01505 [Candidatus Lokiarchaeota archaeon]|nr:hypothetical protein [Candidatus Lokiarchaeota archaeon]
MQNVLNGVKNAFTFLGIVFIVIGGFQALYLSPIFFPPSTFLANLPLFLDSLLVVSIGIALFMIKNSI